MMIKNLHIILFLLLFYCVSLSQSRYITRNGEIIFNASTPLENINPINDQVSCILDIDNGNIVFQLRMVTFQFDNALMEDHFNEKYMESDQYPKSYFVGKIEDWNVMFLDGQKHNIKVLGDITIHGTTKSISVIGSITKSEEKVLLSSEFTLIVEDFNVKIPQIVKDKISKQVIVVVNIILNKE